MTDTLDESMQSNPGDDLTAGQNTETWSIPQLVHLIRMRTGMKKNELAEKIKVDKENFYKWAKGTKPSSEKEELYVQTALIDIIKEYNNQLEEGKIRIPTDLPELRFNPAHPLVGIPLYGDDALQEYTDVFVAAGSIKKINGKDCLIAYKNTIPALVSSEGFINVFDSGLGDQFRGGVVIAITKQKFFKNLYAGYYHYIIDKNHTGRLRRIRISTKNNLTLISDVDGEDNVTMSLDDITAVFTVDWFITKQFPDKNR